MQISGDAIRPHKTHAVSALQFHGLTTELPRAAWLMVHHEARTPTLTTPRLEVVHATGQALSHGVEEHELELPALLLTPSRRALGIVRSTSAPAALGASETWRSPSPAGYPSPGEIARPIGASRAHSRRHGLARVHHSLWWCPADGRAAGGRGVGDTLRRDRPSQRESLCCRGVATLAPDRGSRRGRRRGVVPKLRLGAPPHEGLPFRVGCSSREEHPSVRSGRGRDPAFRGRSLLGRVRPRRRMLGSWWSLQTVPVGDSSITWLLRVARGRRLSAVHQSRRPAGLPSARSFLSGRTVHCPARPRRPAGSGPNHHRGAEQARDLGQRR